MANLRDLGGLAISGGTIRTGRLLRSAAPARFDASARAHIQQIAPTTIVDLRSAAERTDTPTNILLGADRIHAPDDADIHAGDPAGFASQCTRSAAATRKAIRQIYAAIPTVQQPAFAALYRALAAARGPLLVHCAVGKDRTGAAIATLLAALGTPHEAILADYLASNAHRAAIAAAFAADPRTATIRAAPAHIWAPLLEADAAYLASLFSALEAWGGARAYVAQAVGEEGLARIADALTHG
jgi:protein-tyrosine phosphatase